MKRITEDFDANAVDPVSATGYDKPKQLSSAPVEPLNRSVELGRARWPRAVQQEDESDWRTV